VRLRCTTRISLFAALLKRGKRRRVVLCVQKNLAPGNRENSARNTITCFFSLPSFAVTKALACWQNKEKNLRFSRDRFSAATRQLVIYLLRVERYMSAGELSLRAAELVALNMYRFVFLWPFSAISQQNIFCVFFSDTSSSSIRAGLRVSRERKKLPERSAAFRRITISLREGAAL
jgi:hypothetical protein